MRSTILLCVLACSAFAFAKQPKPYRSGKIMQMNSVSCSEVPQSLADDLLENGSARRKNPDAVCQEYVIATEDVIYRILPRDGKHPFLLPVGEEVQFRFENDTMLLRVEQLNNKEREYVVLSIAPRPEEDTTASYHLNHLQ